MRHRIALLVLVFAILLVNASFAWSYTLVRMYGTHGEIVKWKGQSPIVEYRINMSGHSLDPSVPVNTAIEEFKAAMATWSNIPTASFKFVYAGTSNLGSGWDGVNNISWSNIGNIGVVAYNVSTYNWNAEMLESDIVFNSFYPFHINGSQNAFDLQNLAAHELGHSVPLGDLYGMEHLEKTMFGVVGMGETKKRTLDQDDIDGISFLYPASSEPTCEYSLSHSNKTFESTGGSDNVTITTSAGCQWRVNGNPNWVIVNPSNGSGSGTVSYSVLNNTGTSQRTTVLSIANKLFTITQNGSPVSDKITADVESVNFGDVKIKTVSTKTFTITNSSSKTVTVTVSRTGNTKDFWIILNKRIFAPGEKATVNVIFSPVIKGNKSLTLKITPTNTSVSPLSIQITGKGI